MSSICTQINNTIYMGTLAVILTSIFTYVVITFNTFYLLFFFDLKVLKTMNDLKIFKSSIFTTISFMIILTSLAGMPPLLGFLPKFILFAYLIKLSNFILVFYFSFLNFFMTYFYLQNLRFVNASNYSVYFCVSNHNVTISTNMLHSTVILNFLNFFGFLYINEISIYFLITPLTIIFN